MYYSVLKPVNRTKKPLISIDSLVLWCRGKRNSEKGAGEMAKEHFLYFSI